MKSNHWCVLILQI